MMHNTTVQQSVTKVSPNSNPTIVMLQAEAGFISKCNATPFCCPCLPFIAPLAAQTPVVSSQGKVGVAQWSRSRPQVRALCRRPAVCRELLPVKSVDAQTSSRWCGVEVKRRESSEVTFVT
ncbi:hypothetical protein TNCV_1210141 [Trichonephila clavipes]|nr:hypothetical protein TNCV_1210141 [Trichonephila clavipes]